MIVEICESMPDTKASNHLAGQLIRSGTSPALNYGEAQSGESRKDFIPKSKSLSKNYGKAIYVLRLFIVVNFKNQKIGSN